MAQTLSLRTQHLRLEHMKDKGAISRVLER